MGSSREIDGTWQGFVFVSGIGMDKPRRVLAFDAFRTITHCLLLIRMILDRAPGEFIWNELLGTSGFPKFIPDVHGSTFTEELEALIDEKVGNATPSYDKATLDRIWGTASS